MWAGHMASRVISYDHISAIPKKHDSWEITQAAIYDFIPQISLDFFEDDITNSVRKTSARLNVWQSLYQMLQQVSHKESSTNICVILMCRQHCSVGSVGQ